MMATVSSMVPFHMLHQDNQNETQHDFSGNVTPVSPASASYDGKGIIITFVQSR